MSSFPRFRPTPSMVVATIALLVALGGTSIAAVGNLLPKNSVASPQVVDGSLLSKDFKAGQLSSGVLAYAYVNRDGTLSTLRTKNVNDLPTKDTPETRNGGYVCLDVTTAKAPQNAVATLDLQGSAGFTAVVSLSQDALPTWCPAGTDAVVLTSSTTSGPTPRAFYIVFN